MGDRLRPALPLFALCAMSACQTSGTATGSSESHNNDCLSIELMVRQDWSGDPELLDPMTVRYIVGQEDVVELEQRSGSEFSTTLGCVPPSTPIQLTGTVLDEDVEVGEAWELRCRIRVDGRSVASGSSSRGSGFVRCRATEEDMSSSG